MVRRESENRLVFYEPPRRFTFGDIILTLYGVSVVCFCFYWVFSWPEDDAYWPLIFFGLLHVYFALNQIFIYYGDRYTFIFDRDLRKAVLEKESFSGNTVEEYDFENIERLLIVQNFDPDTVDGWDVELELKTGERRAVPNSFSSSEKAYEEIVRTANSYLTR